VEIFLNKMKMVIYSSNSAADDDSVDTAAHNVNVGINSSINPTTPVELDGANPDEVMARLKTFKEEAIVQYGLKTFNKSYTTWSKLKPDQKNKALAWLQKLLEHIQY
jgi:hypothetical protein